METGFPAERRDERDGPSRRAASPPRPPTPAIAAAETPYAEAAHPGKRLQADEQTSDERSADRQLFFAALWKDIMLQASRAGQIPESVRQ